MVGRVSEFATPKVVYHGPGALAQLDAEIRRLGGERVGLITDPGIVKAGICERVLESTEIDIHCCDQAEPEPSYELVAGCVDFMREHHCDLVIGLGGGSSMDTAKMAAVLMKNEGGVTDYWGANRVPGPGIPLIAIPTTAGTGSEASPAAVFVDPTDGTKKGVRSGFLLPEVAILDPTLTLTLPQPLTAATGVDALTHAIECYTSPRATLISDMAAERSIELIGEHLLRAYARGDDIVARTGMLMASYLAGITLSIANVGIVHALAQTLGGIHGVRHGVANSLFLPYAMEFNRIGCREKYANVAALLGENVEGLSLDEASRKAVKVVRRLTQDLRLPQRLGELDIPEDSLDLVAQRCLETQGRIATNNPRVLSLEEAKEILHRAY